jgi:hypothetical protein
MLRASRPGRLSGSERSSQRGRARAIRSAGLNRPMSRPSLAWRNEPRFAGAWKFIAARAPARRNVVRAACARASGTAPRPLPPSSTAGARAMGYVYLVAEIVWAALSLYWAIRFREFRNSWRAPSSSAGVSALFLLHECVGAARGHELYRHARGRLLPLLHPSLACWFCIMAFSRSQQNRRHWSNSMRDHR